ncbi:Protein phosphatase 2C family protein [Perilla frutescens var. hirtella]|nr:Protein phosphatase 2C family protein [Perilla frutescens var. hirtella]KAH6817284.1 Protein phosphatase 2C family protein [Perilla frutescens var. frutescens]
MEKRLSSQRWTVLGLIKKIICLEGSSPDTGKGKSKSSAITNRVSHGFHLVKGQSGHDMEDYHFAEYQKKKDHVLGLFAIFDGHLGDRVPSYLKDNLFNNILEEPNFWEDREAAIKNAYRSTDKLILEKSMQLGPGGSTAVTAIVIDGKDLWVANVGDSRAVVCRNKTAEQLTVDHEPHNERKRIEKQGGFVTTLPGDVPRVNGQLAVARAFGDENLKAHLSSEPDVCNIHIDSNTEFVILASDGLWKVMNNQEAVDTVKGIKDPQAAAKRLTTEALARKSKDDISCIVIRFG